MNRDRENNVLETAIFAAGCFWHVQADFDKIKGVLETTAGYTGGDFENPKYEEVHTGKTGHVESVLVKFDPSVTTYGDLLKAFWRLHDPTTKNRQGFDIGNQYRSVIFYQNEKQKEEAEKSRDELAKSGKFKKPIVTEILPAKKFWPAEEYHQKYFQKTGQRVC
ncbi:MAG: peptide-methionine (S)-S-oxide reductase MsrA [Patescibacteria group bacterium]|nr:peptide-methionine (S)-S-oxide reductase MsrA [Patescibacteria group bacterium]